MAGFVLSMFRDYKIAALLVILIACPAWSSDGEMIIDRTEGDVYIRHGVTEEWKPAVAGELLRPEDSIRTGAEATAVLRREDGSVYGIPAETIVDGSDFRSMGRDELLLLLAMEDMLSVPDRIETDRPIPQTTVLHGSPRVRGEWDMEEVDIEPARFRINGARFLIGHNYRGPAVLKIRETLRLYPEGDYRIGAMMLAAESLETLELYEEAARYYETILDEDADPAIRRTAESRLERIKNK